MQKYMVVIKILMEDKPIKQLQIYQVVQAFHLLIQK